MEIAAGWKGSPLDHLWEEILLLNRYLSILEEYLKKNLSSRYSVMPLQFPSNFSHSNVKVIHLIKKRRENNWIDLKLNYFRAEMRS